MSTSWCPNIATFGTFRRGKKREKKEKEREKKKKKKEKISGIQTGLSVGPFFFLY